MKRNGVNYIEVVEFGGYDAKIRDLKLVKAALKVWEADPKKNRGYSPEGYFTAQRRKQEARKKKGEQSAPSQNATQPTKRRLTP